MTREWEVPAYLLRIRHLTEIDGVLDKKLETQDLLCDEVRDMILEHLERFKKETQCLEFWPFLQCKGGSNNMLIYL